MIPFQQNSDCAYLAAEVWKGNTFKTAFKSKWCGQPKVSKRNNSLTFFEPQQSLQNEHSSNSLQIEVDQDRLKCTKRTLFHISIYESKALRNEHFPNSIQSELCGFPKVFMVQQRVWKWTVFLQPSNGLKCTNGTLFLHSLMATKRMNWTFFQQPSNWSDQDSLKCTKGKTFLQICIPQQSLENEHFPTAFALKWVKYLEVNKQNTIQTRKHFSNSRHIKVIRAA